MTLTPAIPALGRQRKEDDVRLKVSLAYRVPAVPVSKVGIRNLRLSTLI